MLPSRCAFGACTGRRAAAAGHGVGARRRGSGYRAARAEGSAELARTNESFERFEREAVALDCLLHALNAAIRADAADRSPMPPADCCPVTGQEYGTGA